MLGAGRPRDRRGVTPMVTVDQARLRPDDPPEISGDNTLIGEVLGWQPTVDLESTVRDTIAVRS